MFKKFPKNLWSKSINGNKNYMFFQKKSQSVPLDSPAPSFFVTKVTNMKRKCFFSQKKTFCSDSSPVYTKYEGWHPCWIIFVDFPKKNWLEVQKRPEKTCIFFRKVVFFSKCSPWHLYCISDKLAEVFLQMLGKFMRIKSKNNEKTALFSKKSSRCLSRDFKWKLLKKTAENFRPIVG